MTDLDQRKRALKQEFQRVRGHWAPMWDDLLEMDPDFFEAYLDFSAVPWRAGVLEPKVKEFIYIAIDAATTHLHAVGLRAHIRNALGHGATGPEILEVLELTATLGIHSMVIGVPALIDEAEAAGHASNLGPEAPDEERKALKRTFIAKRGYWNDLWEQILRLAPDLFEAYIRLSGAPWESGPLAPKVKEFIYIAVNAATTHMFEPGTRAHMKNAFAHGATVAEVLEVLELVSVLGIHSVTLGVPILIEELAAAGGEAG